MKKHERRAVSVVFRSSLASETLFLVIFDEKTRATSCFQRFSLVACKRNAVFCVFCISLMSDSSFFHLPVFRLAGIDYRRNHRMIVPRALHNGLKLLLSQEKSCCVFAQFNFNYYICKEKSSSLHYIISMISELFIFQNKIKL